MNPNSDPQANPTPTLPTPNRRFWQNIGGSSLSISLCLHLLLVCGGVVWVFKVIPQQEKDVDFTARSVGGSATSAVREDKQRTQVTRSNLSRVSAVDASTGIVLPAPEDVAPMSSVGAISSGSLSTGGTGTGGNRGPGNWQTGSMVPGTATGPLFKMIPEDMRKRCSKSDRLARLKENGGTPACEEGVEKSLRWLKANQNPDGSWGKKHQPAMTGLGTCSPTSAIARRPPPWNSANPACAASSIWSTWA